MARRSTSTSTRPADRDVVVGIVRGPHGLRGEVRVEPLTDAFAERFRVGARLDAEEIGTVTIASIRGTASDPILRFEGVEDRTGADRLRNRQLRVSRAEARRAAGEGYLWDDLVGMAVVTPDGASLGVVREVLRAGATDVLVVHDGERERMLPALASVVRSVDLGARRIVAVPQEEL